MNVSVEIVEEKSLAPSVADEIVACVNDAIDEKGRCSLVLSGGKTPSSIYRLLGRPPRVQEIDWSKVYLYWGDERWVPRDDLHSNYHMTEETLLTNLLGVRPHIHAVDTSLSSPQEGAKAYEEAIRKSEGWAKDDTPEFDVVLLGLGEDGHIASIFPNTAPESDLCFATKQEESGQDRITLSRASLFGANKIIFIVKGEHKAEILKRVLQEPLDSVQYPAASFKEATGDVSWFVDSAAALHLNKDEL